VKSTMPKLGSVAALAVLFAAACTDAPVQPVLDWSHAHSHAPAAAHEADHSAAQNQLNAAIREGTARYQQYDVARADGYVRATNCALDMGFHYVKLSLLDGVIDPTQPEMLLYEPQKNGEMRLVAVEFVVPAAAWDPFNDGPPMFGSRVFDDHRQPGMGGPPFPHYQLHAWVWKHNPDGIYTPRNPTASCEFA
jgi:hypothetical protein